mmetsp:Transcript_3660/g.9219  ORF Transcript_3660/g.9219 Transcript_3660/m.9219 type:complete len:203 (+) Transcript_3660:56-664(+)
MWSRTCAPTHTPLRTPYARAHTDPDTHSQICRNQYLPLSSQSIPYLASLEKSGKPFLCPSNQPRRLFCAPARPAAAAQLGGVSATPRGGGLLHGALHHGGERGAGVGLVTHGTLQQAHPGAEPEQLGRGQGLLELARRVQERLESLHPSDGRVVVLAHEEVVPPLLHAVGAWDGRASVDREAAPGRLRVLRGCQEGEAGALL